MNRFGLIFYPTLICVSVGGALLWHEYNEYVKRQEALERSYEIQGIKKALPDARLKEYEAKRKEFVKEERRRVAQEEEEKQRMEAEAKKVSLIHKDIKDIIKKNEGFHSKTYVDIGGTLTICYGNTSKAIEGASYSNAECEILFHKDVETAIKDFESTDIYKKHKEKFAENRNEHIKYVDLFFNVGKTNIVRAKKFMKQAVKNPFSVATQKEYRSFTFVKGKYSQGLANRRATMIALANPKQETSKKSSLDTFFANL